MVVNGEDFKYLRDGYICLKKNKNKELENDVIICLFGFFYVVVIEDVDVYYVVNFEYKYDNGMLGFYLKVEWLINVYGEILVLIFKIE